MSMEKNGNTIGVGDQVYRIGADKVAAAKTANIGRVKSVDPDTEQALVEWSHGEELVALGALEKT